MCKLLQIIHWVPLSSYLCISSLAGMQASDTFVSRVIGMQPPRPGKNYYRYVPHLD